MVPLSRSLFYTLFLAVFAINTCVHTQAVYAAPPANFQVTPVITTGLQAPSGFGIAPDGRFFILERTGEIRLYKNGQLLPQLFAVLPSVAAGDRGLISVTFDPDFLNNHYVYFYYSSTDSYNKLVRFDASGDVGTNGPVILYQAPLPSELLHAGGALGFGPDGKLYLGIGDNGYHPNAQDMSNPHGKIIRINKDGSIPSDNPYIGQTGIAPEIWANGFRNPWKLQFNTNGRLYVSDVGEADWEEINLVVRGGNYGWPLAEGLCSANCTGLINPIYSYPHNGGSAAVGLGPIYRGSMFPPSYQGVLFFADYALGFTKYATLDSSGGISSVNTFNPESGSVVEIEEGTDGSLYYLNIYPAGLFKVIYSTGNKLPQAQASAGTTQGDAPLTVTFSSQGTSDPDGDTLSYLWDFGDSTTSTAANPSKTYAAKGRYVVQLKVSDGTYTVLANPIVIQAGQAPTLAINSPVNNTNYIAGDVINFSSTATDSSGTPIPPSGFTTEVFFHHQIHIHPFLGPLATNTGSFTIPTTGESSAETYFEVNVKATDTNGLSTNKTVFIFPTKANLSLVSQPPGLQVLLDGIPTDTGQTISNVVGFKRELRPLSQQLLNGTYYQLDHWWNNGPAANTVTIPSSDLTATAFYSPMSAFTGQYYANSNLSGNPVLTRQDPIIDFNWSGSSPNPGIAQDNYSVRWEKQQHFVAGRYVFTTSTDDGVRLYIDGALVIDQWHDQAPIPYSYTADLTTGSHAIKMEYYQAAGGAVARLSWDLTPNQGTVPTPTPSPSVSPTPSPTPQPTVLPTPSNGELLSSSWTFKTASGGSSDQYQEIPATALNGMTTLSLTYDLHGFCILTGDASAIIFDQPKGGEWHYISLADYGKNCFDGTQTVSIPLSNFPGLNTAQAVGTFHGRLWQTGAYNVTINSAKLSGTSPTPTPTPSPSVSPTPMPGGTELLSSAWHLTSGGGTAEAYQSIPANVLQGKDTLRISYDLHGFCAFTGDASAIVFDLPPNGDWSYVSLANYGNNCQNGQQTVDIPLSAFPGLNTAGPVGAFHTRFWSSGAFTVDISSAQAIGAGSVPIPTPTPSPQPTVLPSPTPTGTQLLSSPWHLSASSGVAESYQAIPSNVLQGKTTITISYDLHGFCALTGDASAIIFDQPPGNGWSYVSLANYGQNCLNGSQTVTIPLSSFPGLQPGALVGTFHTRFWSSGAYTVDITSASVN